MCHNNLAAKRRFSPKAPYYIKRMSKEVPFTLSFLGVKILDIGLTTVYFFAFGIFAAKCFDLIYTKTDEKSYEQYSLPFLFMDIILHLFLLGITAYGLRNLIELIPYPLNGVAGYDHFRLKELEGGEVLALILILFQKDLQKKVHVFVQRLFGEPVHNKHGEEHAPRAMKGRR